MFGKCSSGNESVTLASCVPLLHAICKGQSASHLVGHAQSRMPGVGFRWSWLVHCTGWLSVAALAGNCLYRRSEWRGLHPYEAGCLGMCSSTMKLLVVGGTVLPTHLPEEFVFLSPLPQPKPCAVRVERLLCSVSLEMVAWCAREGMPDVAVHRSRACRTGS